MCPRKVPGEMPSRLDDHEVGGVALRYGDRRGVGDGYDPEEQRRERRLKAPAERQQQRKHEHDRTVERDRRGQQRAERAHQHIQGKCVSSRAYGKRAGRSLRESRALGERGKGECGAENAISGARTSNVGATRAPRMMSTAAAPPMASAERGLEGLEAIAPIATAARVT
jgi:hypothetical protein